MRAGLVFLLLGYVLSQFYRACLAVLAPFLADDIGATAADLARASGLWFLIFAAMQIPVGWALDKLGPRRTAAWLLGLGAGGGAALFALAPAPWALDLAMALIGIGCSPVLMAGYFIFARTYPAALFATLAGAMLGAGTLGNLAAALPLSLAAETIGWRASMALLAGVTLVVALGVGRFVSDPPRAEAPAGGGSLLSLLAMPTLWPVYAMMIVNYAPAAGLRGVWIGPYLGDVFGMDSAGIGTVGLAMGLAMVAGNFAYGPLDRLFGSRKWVVLGGNLLVVGCLLALWAAPGAGIWQVAVLLAAVGLLGASFPMIMAHGRSFFPPHLAGRGVTLLNLFGIGSVGVAQMVSGPFHAGLAANAVTPEAPYAGLFLAYALFVLAGCAIYLFSRDRTD